MHWGSAWVRVPESVHERFLFAPAPGWRSGCRTVAGRLQRVASPSATTGSPAQPPLTVSEAQATQGSIHQTLSYTGELRAPGQVSILTRTAGTIQHLAVGVGSQVRAGDVLAIMDSSSA